MYAVLKLTEATEIVLQLYLGFFHRYADAATGHRQTQQLEKYTSKTK